MYKIIIFCLLLIGCQSNETPEGVLKSFIEKRLNDEIKADDLDDFLTGDLLDEYTQALGEDPNKLNEANSFKDSRLKIIYQNCNGEECSITYTLSYDTDAKTDDTQSDVSISVRKIALLVKKGEKWFIANISDVKSFYQFKEEDIR